jgi:peptidoglycan/xylan/chitin deacetylase (PgdA/CDA1 family)
MILLYHRIAPVESDPWSLCVTPEHFAEHVEVLRRYRPIKFTQTRSLGRIFDRGDFSVAITFDDGYADNFYQAAPLLERYEIPASFFIATSYVGTAREFWWDELEKLVFQTAPWLGAVELTASGRTRVFQMDCDSGRMPLYLSLYEFLQPLTHEARLDVMDRLLQCSGQITAVRPSHRVMTRDELIKLAGAGLFEIGAHTVTHPKLSTQSIVTQQTEILGSKTWLEELLGKSIISFSYPYGGKDHFTEATVELVRNAGFSYACTNAARYVKWIDAPLELPRFNITDMNGEEFEKRLFY